MDPLTDEQRIAGLTREPGDLDLAERLVDARGDLLSAVPDHVGRTPLSTILAASGAWSVADERPRIVAGRSTAGTWQGCTAEHRPGADVAAPGRPAAPGAPQGRASEVGRTPSPSTTPDDPREDG